MKRYVAIITAAAVLVLIALLVVLEAPPPEKASAGRDSEVSSSSTAATQVASSRSLRAAVTAKTATPPKVALQKLPQTFDQPLYVTSPPGDTARLFVVEKTGRIRIVKNGTALGTPFLDIHTKVSTGSEQGLLGLAFDPRYSTNRRFYVDYTNTAGDTRVVRYVASASNRDVAVPSSAKVILRVAQPYPNHNGGQLAFGPDGKLYVGMGDGGSGGDPQGHAQDSRSRLGKLLRIDVNTSPMKIVVYAKGLRNPWRFSFDRANGNLWIGDVGQDRWEEIDFLRAGRPAGANLGWNGFEGTHVYDSAVASRLDKSKLTWPVAQYSHSFGQAVTGGYVYRGSSIPALRGWYLFADFASGHVWAKRTPGAAKQYLRGADGQVTQIASFGQDAAGELYIVSLAGSVYKIVP